MDGLCQESILTPASPYPCSSRFYMAPEVSMSGMPHSKQSDVYSFGAWLSAPAPIIPMPCPHSGRLVTAGLPGACP